MSGPGTTTQGDLVHPDQKTLDGLLELYDAGQYLDAYRQAISLGPLTRWRGAQARIVAGRLASNLGGQKMGRVLRRLAFREHPDVAEAVYFQVSDRANLWGPLQALEFQQAHSSIVETATAPLRSEWFSVQAVLYAYLRDWENADAAMARARDPDPEGLWIRVDQAVVLEQRDRYQDALDLMDEVLGEHPWYRPAVQQRAHLLRLLSRDDEALASLRGAMSHLQSYSLGEQSLELELEQRNIDQVKIVIERLDVLGPCRDRAAMQRVHDAHMEVALHEGNVQEAIHHAKAVKSPFHTIVAENLERCGEDATRVHLPVPFVRQHHMTCGPATLDALCRFWKVDSRQPQIIEEIWFDGTTDFRERQWTSDSGFVTREFMLTWGIARALIDRGVPFALATVETTSAHLQAAVGYDAARRTLIIRDPTRPQSTEFLLDQALEHYASTGPRAMVFVPQEETGRIIDLELPEEALYDRMFEMRCALDRHDRPRAQRTLDEMLAIGPGTRLTLQAERILAYYDADEVRVLKATDALIELYPDDTRLTYARQSSLARLGRREEREACLSKACEHASADLALMAAYAELLLEDWRNRDQAESMVRTLLRRSPYEPEHYLQLATIRWREARFDAALMLYRLAACLADLNSRYVQAFFDAARLRNHTEEALAFLRDRFERFGRLAATPALSLIQALDVAERSRELQEVIEEALKLRPDDPDLHLELGDLAMRTGRRDEAKTHLDKAHGRVRSTEWLLSAAHLARLEGDVPGALNHLYAILDQSPMDMSAVRNVAQLLAESNGTTASLAFIERQLDRFPQSLGLLTVYLERTASEPISTRLRAADRLLAEHPTDLWARRERALILGDAGRYDEAIEEVQASITLAPMESMNHSVAGALALRQGHLEQARQHYATAIKQDADNSNAIVELIRSAPDTDALLDAISLIEREFERQVLVGDGLLAYQQVATSVLAPSVLLESLNRAQQARPDLWQTWVALGDQQVANGDLEDAVHTQRTAAERFSLVPRVWVALANACRHAEYPECERDALLKAYRINPDYERAVAGLADFHENRGEMKHAREVVERALARDPSSSRYQAYLADYLWKDGERGRALEHIRKAAELDPGYDWAWEQLRSWSTQCGQPDLPETTARSRVEKHPGEARSYLLLARMLADPEERLRVLDQAITKEPAALQAHQERIEVLCELGRLDDIASVLELPVWQGRPPAEVRGWIAQAKHRCGNSEQALTDLKELVSADAHYFDGWKMLADLQMDREEYANCLDTARTLSALRPRDPVALGYLGDAALSCDQKDLARDSFDAAVRISPGYLFAQSQRFELALLEGDFGRVESALEAFLAQGLLIAHAHREVRVSVARDDELRAMKALRNLLPSPDDEIWTVAESVPQISEKWGRATVHETLREFLNDRGPTAGREIGRQWGLGVGDTQAWQAELPFLSELIVQGSAGLGAAIAYLEQLEASGDPDLIDSFVSRHGEALGADAEAWASIVSAYRVRGFAETACTWAENWHERSDLGPWELGQVAIACWDTRRSRQALAAHEKALQFTPDGTRIWHLVWYALGAGIQGDHDACARALDEAGDTELPVYAIAIRGLAGAVREATNPALTSKQAVSQATTSFREARPIYRPVADDTLRWFAREVRRIILSRHEGSAVVGLLLHARMTI